MNEGLAERYRLEFGVAVLPTYETDWKTHEIGWILGGVHSASLLEGSRGTVAFPYDQAHMLMHYFLETYGYPAALKMLQLTSQGVDGSSAMRDAIGKTYDEFGADFLSWKENWSKDNPLYQPPVGYIDCDALLCLGRCTESQTWAGVSLADLSAEAAFLNPSSTGRFQYGFTIRDDSDEQDAYIDVKVSHDRTWTVSVGYYGWPPKGVARVLDSGTIDGSFDTGLEGRNHLEVIAWKNWGALIVNDELVSRFDLSALTTSGDIAVASHHGDVWYEGFATVDLGGGEEALFQHDERVYWLYLGDRYDANGNGLVDREDVIAAIADYFAGAIEKRDVIGLIRLYLSGAPIVTP